MKSIAMRLPERCLQKPALAPDAPPKQAAITFSHLIIILNIKDLYNFHLRLLAYALQHFNAKGRECRHDFYKGKSSREQ
ncbi:MAG: hypothetical protein ACRYGK_03710 [Janthinobacterium lividum]